MTEAKHTCDCEEVAEKAVRKVFLQFGVDINNHEEVLDFQKSINMSSTIRKIVDKSFITIIGLVVTAMFTSFMAHILGVKVK